MTAFHLTAAPFAYAPGYGLPFSKSSGLVNNAAARTQAMAYALYNFALYNQPPSFKPALTAVSATLLSSFWVKFLGEICCAPLYSYFIFARACEILK